MAKKIIDCFLFFDEVDILDIRLRYLYDFVDYFVICEADKTFSGNDKRSVFLDNKERFASFKDKILYIPIKMKFFKEEKEVEWKREYYQRDSIVIGLRKLKFLSPKDLILISDVDEIPNIEILRTLKKNVSKRKKKQFNFYTAKIFFNYIIEKVKEVFFCKKSYEIEHKILWGLFIKRYTSPIIFYMLLYYYYVNNMAKKNITKGVVCFEMRWLKILSFSELRRTMHSPNVEIVNNAGWHFSYLGGKDKVAHKLKSYSHQEFNIPGIVSKKHIDLCIKNGYWLADYYFHPNETVSFCKKVKISDFPDDLRRIIIQFKHLINSH